MLRNQASHATNNSPPDGEGKRRSTLRARESSTSAATSLSDTLNRTLAQLEAVTLALASSRREVQAARDSVQTLTEINLRLDHELADLARKEARVRDFAYHDELTGLPNRRLLLDRLRQAIAQAARHNNQVVLLLLDLDGFKHVNDTLGHPAGDKLLQGVGRRLTDGIRGADTACRYGGDEFLVMLPEVDSPGMATAVWGKLKLALDEPYLIDTFQVRVATSMGAVVYPTDGQTEEELIRRADAALYRAKARRAAARIEALPRNASVKAEQSFLVDCTLTTSQPLST
jgi:diguanylate cyclase (GGDEF)-like protein